MEKKGEAKKLTEQGELNKKDKRSLYLAKEGVILPDTPAAEGVSKQDMEKRQKGWAEKKKKLRNPNFSVSPTRLAVRNIPFAVTDKELRQLVLSKTKEALRAAGQKIGSVAVKQVRIDRDPKRLDKDGKLKTLPNTGTAESILGAIGAMLLTAVSYVYKKKMF